jgi:hypothetical protein
LLLWAARHNPTEDYRTILRISTEDGSLIWEWRRSPGYGRYSTDHWHAGELVQDEYQVEWPDWLGPGLYHVEIGLYPFNGPELLPQIQGEAVATDEHPFYSLGWLERKPNIQ